MVFDAGEIGSIAVFDVEVCLATKGKGSGTSKVLVDVRDLIRDVLERFVEKIETLLFDSGEFVFRFFCSLTSVLEVLFGSFEACFDTIKPLDSAHIGIELLQFSVEIFDSFLELLFYVLLVGLDNVNASFES